MTQRRRSLFAAAGAVATAVLLATTSACGSSAGKSEAAGGGKPAASAKPTASAKSGDGLKIPDGLPTSIDDVKNWKWNDWSGWAKQKDFKNPRIQALWTTARMKGSKAFTVDTAASSSTSTGGTPRRITAVKESQPYRSLGWNGKLFFDTPEGHMVCSATVVTDPQHPGKSNLVWTAGHCVHGGRNGSWYRNLVFIPGYDNNNGSRTAAQVAPYGQWWANLAGTSSTWMNAPSAHQGSAAAAGDYAVLRVVPPKGVKKSLQETVGAAAKPWFGAPLVKTVVDRGYPQAPPFNGQFMYHCAGRTGPVAMYSTKANQQWMGCSMTPGASGGGWMTKYKNHWYLVGNNSLTDAGHNWFSSPILGANAKSVYLMVARHR